MYNLVRENVKLSKMRDYIYGIGTHIQLVGRLLCEFVYKRSIIQNTLISYAECKQYDEVIPKKVERT